MLKIENAKKTFFPGTVNERIALRGINLNLDPGDFVTIIGSNGAGKSTLLNSIAGTVSVDSGTIAVNGKVINKLPGFRRAKMISRVFQDPQAGTAPHQTIEQNLVIALTRGQSRGLGRGLTKERRELFKESLQTLGLGLENRLNHRVGLLSGGQRQALSLLMASFTKPDILLLDEHTAALDPERAQLVTQLTGSIIADGKLTALMVTHNMEQAIELGNSLVMMHEGQIVLQLNAEQKKGATVASLLEEFSKVKGTLSDRSLLQ